MFTGLIEEVGTVIALRVRDHGTELQIAAPGIAKHVSTGESIAVNGCCLTLTSCRSDCLSFDLLEETIARTNLSNLRQNSPVNLERALRADDHRDWHVPVGESYRDQGSNWSDGPHPIHDDFVQYEPAEYDPARDTSRSCQCHLLLARDA